MPTHRCCICLGYRMLGGEPCEHCSGTGFEPQRPPESLLSQDEINRLERLRQQRYGNAAQPDEQ